MTTQRTQEINQYLADRLIGEEISADVWARLDDLSLIPDDVVRLEDGTAESLDNVCEIDGEYHHIDGCFRCEHCESWGFDDDSCSVDDETWCDHCRSNDAYYWESDDSYHSEPEPEEDEDDEDREYPNLDVIADYHRYNVDPRAPIDLADDVIGVELETFWDDPCEIADWMSSQGLTPSAGWKIERDGSLDRTHGVEIVSKPIRFADVISADASLNPWRRLFQFAKGKSRAWDMGKGYGLHLSINRAKMTRIHAIKFARLINGSPDLCAKIAGRTDSGYSTFSKTDRFCDQGKYQEKYLACAMRSETRIEVRIFRASWNWERFVRNCQFVESIRRYTRDCSLNDNALSDVAYLRWLNGLHGSQFRDLRAWFAEKTELCAVAE